MQASVSTSPDAIHRAHRRVARFRLLERLALVLAWALVVASFGVAVPNGTYLTWTNFSVLFTSQAPSALLALALIVPLTAGDYDLSVGANVTLAAMIIGVFNAKAGWPLDVVLPLSLASGAAVGVVNAFFIVYVRIPSLVVTLATASLITGVVQWMSGSSTISGISPWLQDVVTGGHVLGLANAFYCALIVAVGIWFVFEYMPSVAGCCSWAADAKWRDYPAST